MTVAVALIVVLGAAGAAAAWYFERSSAVGEDGSAQALAANALGTAREAAVFFRDSAARDVGNLSELLRKSDAEEEEEEEEEVEAENGGGNRTDVELVAAVVKPVVMGPTIDEWMTGAPGPSLTRQVTQLASAEVPTEPPLFMVFDDTHPGVSPPGTDAIRMRSDLFPGLRISDVASDDTGLVEVVVGAEGKVETAKLISAPQNVHESMFLSAVKAWQFDPATKNGQAVRYRHQMHIAIDR